MNNRALWQDIPIKKQGIIFVISYYRITIASEQRYLQDITGSKNYFFIKLPYCIPTDTPSDGTAPSDESKQILSQQLYF
jgi:hypothetical protein